MLQYKMAASVTYHQRNPEINDKIPLVSFSQGKLRDLKNEVDSSHPCFKVFKHSENLNSDRKKDWRIVKASGPIMDYVGFNYGIQAPKADSTSKYLVGVLDKATGKMKAYDAQLFNLKPWMKREEKMPSTALNGNSLVSLREKNDELIETFGSNKKKRAMHSRLRNKVSEDSLQKTATHAAETAKELPLPTDAPDAAGFQVLPPSNKETNVPSEIYPLDDILSANLISDLKDMAKGLIEASTEEIQKWKEEQSYPQYVLEKLPLSETGKSLLSLEQIASILVYMKILMQVFITKKRTVSNTLYMECCWFEVINVYLLSSVTIFSEIPLSVKEHICESFFQETSSVNGKLQRSLTKLSKNKIMVHLLLLALHVDGFLTSLEPLQKDTGVAQAIMLKYVRSFGGKTKKMKDSARTVSSLGVSSKYMMELKGPLTIVSRRPGPMLKKR